MTAITSAGAGSGIDLESVISASLAAKKAQLQQPITTKKNSAEITLSGVGQLKSAISSYTSTLDAFAKDGAFNKRTISITQDKDDPVMTVASKTGASNGQYNITVNKLAATSKQEGIFDSSSTPLATADGTLTFKAGGKEFSIDVKAGDTLQNIRKRINADGDNFGLSANIVNTSDGKAKLVLDSGISGDGKDMTITSSTDELKIFETGAATSKMSPTQAAASAMIVVDGSELTSDTNTFDGTIEGLKVTVNRLSDKNTDGSFKSNKVAITTDKTSIQTLIQGFLDGYNSLVDKTTALGKRNTIVSGESQDDGGALAGDSTTNSIKNLMTNMISNKSSESSVYSTIFQLGVKMDNKGKLSLDSDKFTEALDKNFDQVVAIFGGEKGVAAQLSTGLKEYTKTGGLLAKRQDSLNSELRSLAQKNADATAQLTKYEASLRAQYGSLDTLLTKMNQSASYLSLISTS